ncbi:hypothetical protein D3C77_815880 [compost metagenome]
MAVLLCKRAVTNALDTIPVHGVRVDISRIRTSLGPAQACSADSITFMPNKKRAKPNTTGIIIS